MVLELASFIEQNKIDFRKGKQLQHNTRGNTISLKYKKVILCTTESQFILQE